MFLHPVLHHNFAFVQDAMDKLEQENIDKLIMRQTGDDSSNKLKIAVEDDDTTLESLHVSCATAL